MATDYKTAEEMVSKNNEIREFTNSLKSDQLRAEGAAFNIMSQMPRKNIIKNAGWKI